MPLRPARTLAEVLDGVLAAGGDAGAVDAADTDIAGLEEDLDAAARAAAAVGGWHPDDPLRLTKAVVTWLLRCPRRALAPPDPAGGDELVAGMVVDAAAKLATLVPQHRPTLDEAIGFLAATCDTAMAERLADVTGDRSGNTGSPDALPDTRADATTRLRVELAARVERLADAWPAIDPAWWPRVEDPVRIRLAGGAVVVTGRLDVALGGPPTGRPAVVVEVKGGRWQDGMRADVHLYALLLALRDGRAPVAAVTVVADGTTEVEPVRPAVLTSAAGRVEEALRVAAGIAAGEPAAAHPGPYCGHCPIRADCPPGRDWRAADDAVDDDDAGDGDADGGRAQLRERP
jgi:hypothetical protein